jgi:DNA-binding NtrC family response regulator
VTRDRRTLDTSRQFSGGLRDLSTGPVRIGPQLDRHAHFRKLLESELCRARTFGRNLALLMLRPAEKDLAVLESWQPAIVRHLRPFDRLSLYGDESIEVLLPETDHIQAREIARAIVDGEREEGQGGLLCGLSSFPEHADSAEELLDTCRVALRNASCIEQVVAAHASRAGLSTEWKSTSDLEQPIVKSAAMRHVYAAASRLAVSPIPVVLIGETGSGKEVVARTIHQRGPRFRKPLVSLNCAAIPLTLIESVLFGHERGAFTGAHQKSPGLFEQADGGTVFLDEIGELAAPAQAALLRVLDTKCVRRIGGSGEVAVDIRLIAATHRSLEKMCAQGRFRWDLYYRLSGFVLNIPPLRERREEIAALARLFVARAARDQGRTVPQIDDNTLTVLESFSWPGNVRELRNAMEHAVLLTRDDRIAVTDLPQKLIELPKAQSRSAEDDASEVPGSSSEARVASSPALATVDLELELRPDLRSAMRRYEARLIVEALRQAEGNRTRAARTLGVSVRTLSNRIKALGIRSLGFGLANG